MEFSETYYRPFLNALDRLGFCTMRVFSDEHITQLQKLYEKHFGSPSEQGLRPSHNANPVDQVLAVNDEIKAIVQDTLQAIFPEYDYFIGHFMVKGPHTTYELPLHQDWNIVDESQYNSYQVWIPLQITYPANGGIFVVPGSHKFFNNQRSGSYGIPQIPYDDTLRPLCTDIIVPPGNVLVYHNGLFHGSYPNQTDEPRLAVIVNFVEKAAPVYYFHKNEAENCTDLYALDGKTLLNNLPQLEKGNPGALTFAGKTALCPTQNKAIQSRDFAEKYQRVFGDKSAAQTKQLSIAIHSNIEDKLNREGYTVIDLLTADEVAFFRKKYDSLFGNIDRSPGRFTTLQHTETSMRNEVHDFIVKEMDTPLRRFFSDFVIPVSQFYTKKAHTSGDIDLHADSSLLLNHQLDPHYAIWIPLLDVDKENGTLTVVPFSHLPQNAFFSGSLGGYHSQHKEWLSAFELPLPLKAGQAVIFDNNLLHNSTANKTDIDRVCITFRMTHFAAQYYSFVAKDADSIDVWEESFNYYMADDWDGHSEKSAGKYKGEMKHSLIRRNRTDIEKILTTYAPARV